MNESGSIESEWAFIASGGEEGEFFKRGREARERDWSAGCGLGVPTWHGGWVSCRVRGII